MPESVNVKSSPTTVSFKVLGEGEGQSQVRSETYMGSAHTVVPCVAIVEGLMWASNAPEPEYVPSGAFSKHEDAWNGRPVVLNHPRIDGMVVSANSPAVLEGEVFGTVFNTKVEENQLTTEIWLSEVRAQELGEDHQKVLADFKAGQIREVSVGAFVDVVVDPSSFRGQQYNLRWADVWPDHLAILPEGIKGACSITDGCGAPRIGEEKEIPIVKAERAQLVTNTADGTEGTSSCEGGCGCDLKTHSVGTGGTTVNKEATVNAIIAASARFDDSHREELMGLSDIVLESLMPAADDGKDDGEATEEDNGASTATATEETPVAETASSTTEVNAPAQPVTMAEYLAAAPPEVRAVMQRALAAQETRKRELVGSLKGLEVYSEKELLGMDIEALEKLARVAKLPTGNPLEEGKVSFLGASGVVTGYESRLAGSGEDDVTLPTSILTPEAVRAYQGNVGAGRVQ